MKPFSTIQEIKALIDNKEITPEEVTQFYLERIKTHNPTLNALLDTFAEDEFAHKEGPLKGIPGILKANLAQEGKLTSCGSKMLENYKSPFDATVKTRLEEAGASIIGTANMDEFAMGSSGQYSAFGATKNPWDLTRSPGGSSSGSAAAVAGGLAAFALGTETGGSIRQPSAFCNLVGLYPTYGMFSRYGLIAFGSSLDQPGPITRTVYDNALVASALSGHDSKDSTSLPEPKKDFTKNLSGKLPDNFTIGVIQDSLDADGIHDEVKESFKKALVELEQLGAKIKYIELPNMKYGISLYFILSRAEAASNMSRFDGTLYGARNKDAQSLMDMIKDTRTANLGDEVKLRIMMGNYVLTSSHRGFYSKANEIRRMIRAEFEDAFNGVDVLTSPTTTTLPFKLGENLDDPLTLYYADYFNVPMCLAGIPSLSVPCGMSKDNLPIGIQFIGPRLSENLLYQVAYAYEQSTDHHLKTPENFE
jgi:aspartyl-tRNA(Asn)/glutamyl-tRNA(Gln) amidotransferase subunit A